MRIRFCGSHGTGKTTLLNLFEYEDIDTVSELARELIEDFWNPKDDNLFWKIVFQKKLFKNFLEKQNDINVINHITDRSLIDILAYTRVLRDELERHTDYKWYNKKMSFLLEDTISEIEDYITHLEYDYTFYFPIVFALEDDGVRLVDLEFQKKIDNEILNILQEFQIPFVVMEGETPEERKKFIIELTGIEERFELQITDEDRERARNRIKKFAEDNEIKFANFTKKGTKFMIWFSCFEKSFHITGTGSKFDTPLIFETELWARKVLEKNEDDLKIIFWIK